MPGIHPPDTKTAILDRVRAHPGWTWTPSDFADVASRAVVDKSLQRLVAAGELRRIDRGLYDRPRQNPLTGRAVVPDYRAVIDAIARRDHVRVLIDGMTAANDLGLTTAVPAKIEAFVDARLRPIRVGTQEIRFRPLTASRLYWAGRPAMRIVQALQWLKDGLDDPAEHSRVITKLRRILANDEHGTDMRTDLLDGFSALPIWMQELLRPLVVPDSDERVRAGTTSPGKPKRTGRS